MGLRGLTLRTASVSTKHANFIQGSDGGRAADVLELIELVRTRVADETAPCVAQRGSSRRFAAVTIDDGIRVLL